MRHFRSNLPATKRWRFLTEAAQAKGGAMIMSWTQFYDEIWMIVKSLADNPEQSSGSHDVA